MSTRYYSPALQHLPDGFVGTLNLNGIEADIYDGLWHAVVEGKLKPGNKLKEETICELYGVSRTVVRKVFVIMAQLGIVALPQNKGAYIATITREEARDVLDMIRLIMTHVVASLAKPDITISQQDRQKIDLHLAAQADAEKQGNAVLSRILSVEFRLLLTLIHGNYILSAEYDALRTRMGLAVSSYYQGYVQPNRYQFQVALVDLITKHKHADAVVTIRKLYDDAEAKMKVNEAEAEDKDFSSIIRQYNYLAE